MTSKQLKPKIGNTKIPAFLHNIGINYHDHGTVKTTKGTKPLFDYYKVDKITQEQIGYILDNIPLAQFRNGSSIYAPEMKKVYILIPKAEYYRQLNDEKTRVIL